ncbi:PaaI family thioesterase [Streptomyces gamaensis]|uniref:PaaI family thioesterase n=1 Tax=Streptomyces gamaensis TaxID=1763542 RepID=A0ABW0Z7S0_9ACTN
MSRPSADPAAEQAAAPHGDPARDGTGAAGLPGCDPARAGAFVAVAGLVVDEASAARVRGHLDLGAHHHTPWGIVNGGVYTTAVESAAAVGASAAVADRGQYAVAVHVSTDLLRSRTGGRAEVVAEPVHQGRSQQLWAVTIHDGRPIARGQVRLQNIPLGRGPA